MIRVRNPFMRSAGNPPIKFVGREDELTELNKALENTKGGSPEHIIFYGPFGIGKTSLLIEFQRMVKDARSIRIPLYRTDNITEICDVILREARLQLKFKESVSRRLRRALAAVGFSVMGTSVSFTLGKVDMNPQSALKELIGSIYDCLPAGSTLVLLIDDLHRIAGDEGKGSSTILSVISNVMLTLNQDGKRIMFIGSGSYDIFKQLRSVDESSVRVFHPHEIKPLTMEDTTQLIKRSAKGYKVKFSDDVILKTYQLSEGNPYHIQILAYYLFEEQEKGEVLLDSFMHAFERALNDLAAREFRRMYEDMSPGARKILATMAESSKDSLKYSELRESSKGVVTSYINELIKEGAILREERGFYKLRDKLFAQYLRTFKPYIQNGAFEGKQHTKKI